MKMPDKYDMNKRTRLNIKRINVLTASVVEELIKNPITENYVIKLWFDYQNKMHIEIHPNENNSCLSPEILQLALEYQDFDFTIAVGTDYFTKKPFILMWRW